MVVQVPHRCLFSLHLLTPACCQTLTRGSLSPSSARQQPFTPCSRQGLRNPASDEPGKYKCHTSRLLYKPDTVPCDRHGEECNPGAQVSFQSCSRQGKESPAPAATCLPHTRARVLDTGLFARHPMLAACRQSPAGGGPGGGLEGGAQPVLPGRLCTGQVHPAASWPPTIRLIWPWGSLGPGCAAYLCTPPC